jgi:hypothetical protein
MAQARCKTGRWHVLAAPTPVATTSKVPAALVPQGGPLKLALEMAGVPGLVLATTAPICPRTLSGANRVTDTDEAPGAATWRCTTPVPTDDIVVTGSCWRTVIVAVVEANEAEGHVTVARLRSTTTSARHQVENRWCMPL